MSSNDPLYVERQSFKQWWIWFIVLSTSIILFWGIFQVIILDSTTDTNPWSNFILIIFGLIFGFGFPTFIYSLRLDTKVMTDKLCIRFIPFHRKWVEFDFKIIKMVEACTYSPIKDYGGWGIRYGGKKGKAYNVSGNQGVLVILSDGRKILIGSKKHELLCSVITDQMEVSK